MSPVRVAQVITAVSLQGRWIKLLQAQSTGEGPGRLLGMKARQISDLSEEAVAATLKELAGTLPTPPKEVVGLLSTGEMLTRYLVLPSENPDELKAMALYQLEGALPFSVQECVTSVKVLGPVGEGTRVLVAAVHRPNVERLVRIAQKAGLNLTRIVASSEAIGCWHRACWPESQGVSPNVWLVAELSKEGLDLGVLVRGSLVYMRQVPHPIGSLEGLVAQLQETIQAYAKEQVGPPVEQVTLSGSLSGFESIPLERLEASLGLSIHRVDPLEASPFRDTLSITASELSPEVSFSELLGVACAPRLLELDLLPLESRWQQARAALFSELRTTALLLGLGVAVVLGWVGAKIGGTFWQLRQTQTQVEALTPEVNHVKEMAATVRLIGLSRQEYALSMELLGDSTKHLLAGMNLQFLGLEGAPSSTLTLRGTAPDLGVVTSYAAALRAQPLWKSVTLRSAKTKQTGHLSSVEFEILLQPKESIRK